MTQPQGTTAAVLEKPTVESLRASLRGRLLEPGDEAYDAARKVFNAMIDRRPRYIVRGVSAADVITAVNFARAHDLPLAVRGNGHNVAGFAVCDDGLVIDLTPMKGIRVDPARRTARAEPGLNWREFDHETQAHGLATTGGLVSTTGISGFTLGGGIGWLVRKHGLTSDNLLSADVVTADGRLVTASATRNPDLFWGLRGGGGNFGVVTSFKYQLHPVGTVLSGLVLHPLEKARDALRFFREFTETVPNELTTLAAFIVVPPAPFIPAHLHGEKMLAIIGCYAGSLEDGEKAVRALRTFGPPALDLLGPMPYTVVQALFDEGAPSGLQNYWKSDFFDEMSDEFIEAAVEHGSQLPSPLCALHIHHLGGAMSAVGVEETAFPHRHARFVTNNLAIYADPAEAERHVTWVRELWSALHPYASGGAYVNFLGDEGDDRVRMAYGPNYDRLVQLKNTYDPANLFHFNQNIRPTA